jgi:hypothetical protein
VLEYILFSERFRDKFICWLRDNNIEFELAGNDEEFLVLIDEDIADSIEEKIEAQYDLVLDESAKAVDEEDSSAGAVHLVGIQYTNKHGEIGQVRIPPELAKQIHRCLDASELQAFVQLIADAVENPNNKSLCQTIN